jgi:Helix-turn-helix domain
MDRSELADFLRARREALQPEDVGLPRGPRRRTGGLRREEVAAISGVSIDFYSRIEQRRGPSPPGRSSPPLPTVFTSRWTNATSSSSWPGTPRPSGSCAGTTSTPA